MVLLLLSLLWATMGGAVALAERGNFGRCGFAANSAVPRGFASGQQFSQASAELRSALGSHGVTDATIGVRGSLVTGTSFKTGQPFGPASDIDFFVESAQMTQGLRWTPKFGPGVKL